MKKIIVLSVCLLALALVIGCAKKKHPSEGMNTRNQNRPARIVTLYGDDGKVIKEYRGDFVYNGRHGIEIYDNDQFIAMVAGTFTVEPK